MVPKDIERWTPEHSFEVGRWMSKIFLGILIKESALPLNQRQPDQGNIVPLDYIDELFLMHLLVQSWRKKIIFNCLHTVHPFTLYVYQMMKTLSMEILIYLRMYLDSLFVFALVD